MWQICIDGRVCKEVSWKVPQCSGHTPLHRSRTWLYRPFNIYSFYLWNPTSRMQYCSGACGGDLLFAEACLKRGLHLEIRIPFDKPTFLHESVIFAGETWCDRCYKVKSHENITLFMMLEELGQLPRGINPYVRNNVWQLCTALAWKPENVRFITLWNRKEGDGPGGTNHMHNEVKNHSG